MYFRFTVAFQAGWMRAQVVSVRGIQRRQPLRFGRNGDRKFDRNTRSYVAIRKTLVPYFHGFSRFFECGPVAVRNRLVLLLRVFLGAGGSNAVPPRWGGGPAMK